MSEEKPGSSIADSSSTTNLRELNENSLSSWWNHPDSNFPSEEDLSHSDLFTKTSNQSGWLNADDFPSELMEPHGSWQQPKIVQSGAESAPDSSLWSTILSSIENGGCMPNNHGVGENILEALSSGNQITDMFALVCDYSKKMETSNNSWEFANSTSYNNTDESILGNDRVDNLSNLVSDWSLSTPGSNLSSFLPSYAQHEMELENLQQQIEAWDFLSDKSVKSNTSTQYQTGSGAVLADNKKNNYYEMSSEDPWFNITSFKGCLNKPIIDHPSSKPTCLESSCQIDNKKMKEISSAPALARRSTTGSKKKKRSEHSSDTQFKKSKHENSTVQATKVHEVKLNERTSIASLQQIVSPFGKTGKASVLLEAIRCIKYLQEQVQLLSNPYMKPSKRNKYRWGMQDGKDKSEAKSDLRSRGLCLVPISCLPKVYKETTGSDQMTGLTYRGCPNR